MGLAPVKQQNWSSEVFTLPCIVSGVCHPHPFPWVATFYSALCRVIPASGFGLAHTWSVSAFWKWGRRKVGPQSLVQGQGHLDGSVSIFWRLEPIWMRLIPAPRRTSVGTGSDPSLAEMPNGALSFVTTIWDPSKSTLCHEGARGLWSMVGGGHC